MTSIEQIIEELNRSIVDLKYHLDKKSVTLLANDANGYDITIYFDPIESIIFFGNSGNHIHFRNIEAHYDAFISGIISNLIGNTRMIEYHWNNKPRNFSMEEKNENEEWGMIAAMSFPNWMFWRKKIEIQEVVKMNQYQLKK